LAQDVSRLCSLLSFLSSPSAAFRWCTLFPSACLTGSYELLLRGGILLPSGKFPRVVIAAAILLAALLLADLAMVPSAKSLLYANSLDLAMVLLAAICSFYVARRSLGYARQLWTLLTVALALESIAQAISTYYQSFLPESAGIPQPSDVLFFLWVAPVFMMFLPPAEDGSRGVNWLRILDCAQVGIVAATAYLYFFYVPTRWLSNEPSVVRQILILYITRDLFLSASFLLRARTSIAPWLRFFTLVMAVVFVAAAFSDGEYLLTLGSFTGTASWVDLAWMFPYFLVVLLAANWRQPERTTVAARDSRFGDFVVTHILPVGIPLLVIFMGRRIAREQLLLAWIAVTASFICSALRLILTNRKQRHVAEELIESDRALRRSEQMFVSAFRSSPDAFSIGIYPDGPLLDVNEGFLRLTGYTREEVLNKTPAELKLWAEPLRRGEILSHLEEHGEIREHEFRFRTKSGELRTGQMSGAILELDGRRCLLVVVRDITERIEAEADLRISEERFRSLVEDLHVGIVVHDSQGNVLFANQSAQNMFGISANQVLGKRVIDLGLVALREDGTPIPAELRPVYYVLATKQPFRSQLIGWSHAKLPDIIWTLVDAVPEFSKDGEIVRVILSLTNLTEQRRAVEALRESEERFRALVRDLHVGVVLHGPDERIQFVNRAATEMFGLSGASLIGKQIRDLDLIAIDEDGREIPYEDIPVPYVLRTQDSVRDGVMGLRRRGSPEVLWIFGNVTPQFDENGTVIRVISSFADITEMKTAERAIHQLSTQLLKLQDEERRRIGRELHDGLAQTVLAVNLSLAQVRQSIPLPDEASSRAFEKARGLLQQMSREIRTLSYLLHPPLLDDLGLVSALKEYVNGFSERSGIAAQLYVLSEFGRLPQAEETALFRIVQESLANIQRHSGSATSRIRLRQEGALVTLEITDFGHGMILPTNGNAQAGEVRLGVGIPGMRERMAQLGGQLDIESGPEGTTVRATILLPDVVSRETDDGTPSHPRRR